MTAVAGVLYVIATPIGARDDISARALSLLGSVSAVLAEDTRTSGMLLSSYGLKPAMVSLHDHNEAARVDMVAQRLRAGDSLALISDAGTPLISDPGFRLVRHLREQQLRVVPVPGACALIAALSVAGLPTDRFAFEGFLPAKSGPRVARLQHLKRQTQTLCFYEAPHRILDTLDDCIIVFGAGREAVIARELTKTFETFLSGSLNKLRDQVEADSNQQRGEIVLLIHGAVEDPESDNAELARVLTILLAQTTTRQAVDIAEQLTGLPHKQIYKLALAMKTE